MVINLDNLYEPDDEADADERMSPPIQQSVITMEEAEVLLLVCFLEEQEEIAGLLMDAGYFSWPERPIIPEARLDLPIPPIFNTARSAWG
jgi:hypothetical protein